VTVAFRNEPGDTYEAVTKSDTVGYSGGAARYLYVGGTGDVVAVGLDGNAVKFSAVPAGTVLPIQSVRVNSTNTTATLMVAIH
jgi:hypothetical protein